MTNFRSLALFIFALVLSNSIFGCRGDSHNQPVLTRQESKQPSRKPLAEHREKKQQAAQHKMEPSAKPSKPEIVKEALSDAGIKDVEETKEDRIVAQKPIEPAIKPLEQQRKTHVVAQKPGIASASALLSKVQPFSTNRSGEGKAYLEVSFKDSMGRQFTFDSLRLFVDNKEVYQIGASRRPAIIPLEAFGKRLDEGNHSVKAIAVYTGNSRLFPYFNSYEFEVTGESDFNLRPGHNYRLDLIGKKRGHVLQHLEIRPAIEANLSTFPRRKR